MAFTDISGDGSGRVYDVNENKRMEDFLLTQQGMFETADSETRKKKVIIRYAVISVVVIALLGGLQYVVSRQK